MTATHTPYFRSLGPLEVVGTGGPIGLGPPQRQALLLRLLSEDCRPVSVERLCEDLWDGNPPSSAVSSVHAHISRLRSALGTPRERGAGRGEAAPSAELLASTSAGYTLRVPPDRRDTYLFERAAERAHRLAACGRPGPARRTAEEALGLWRGQPYAEARGLLFARQASDRLEGLRRSVQDLRARLFLDEGRADRAVAAAEELTGRDPLRETSWVTLLRSLHAAGRTAEALQRYETVRRMLADTLGADPGPELRRTHLALLRQDGPEAEAAPGRRCAARRGLSYVRGCALPDRGPTARRAR
ncbi:MULTISPECIES: AfsR/SARP family transcriptional regulator [Streptomyces]|uniref:AfsR/SARP family transcriptional regulator n=1 Tax=Streptomyces lycii TaxID=2654337 RepID=A0ABQ7FH77_9ACTN|nr:MULTISPECIES: AfsR/SARP family transcriptional regulator [Streptomyces]KAF4406598.1 AfsR/SARP family transcriptional regulator [Streptomyces lycii]PGH50673.1 hypothetical protein CRI70_10815 [Streptomyces sp. Ru87]